LKNLKIFTFFVLFLVLTPSSIYAQEKSGSKKEKEVKNLYQTVKTFSDAWYKEKNQDKFWNFVAIGSKLRELRKTKNAFLAPFEGEPEKAKPETFKTDGLSKENLEKIRKENLKPAPLNPDTATGLVIYKADDGFLKKAFNLSDEKLASLRKDSFFPSQEFFLVLYGVSGEGYFNHGFVSFWVKEGNDWKLFNFVLVQR